MRMDSSSKDDCCKLNGTIEVQGACCAKSGQPNLSIQRCHSDGVLMNGCLKYKAMSFACKSSSESSMNGTAEKSLGKEATANGYHANVDNNLSPLGENSESLMISCTACENTSPVIQSNQNSDGCDVVRPKTWSRRAVEKKKDKDKSNKRKGKLPGNNNSSDVSNGVDVGYSRIVCDTYRHETDLIFGRMRGGTRRNIEPQTMELPQCQEHGIGTPATKNFNSKLMIQHANNFSKLDISGVEKQKDFDESMAVIAPLALPEDFSDDEVITSAVSTENTNAKELLVCLSVEKEHITKQSSELPSSKNDNFKQASVDTEIVQNSEWRTLSLRQASSNSSQTENVLNGAQCINYETHRDITPENSNIRDEYESSNPQNICNNLHQNEVHLSHTSSLESIDDIGDFIEADLPPNVEQYAFFSRGSSTDEDEGCGDEVLPNDEGGEESENETIDPLVDYRRSELLLLNNENNPLLNGMHQSVLNNSNLLSDPVKCDGDDSDNDMWSNVTLDNSSEQEAYSDNSTRSKINTDFNLMQNSSGVRDRNSGSSSVLGDDNCVCCDRQVDVRYQRTEEIGVIVCDNCFNELDFVGNKKYDHVVRKKSRTLGATPSSNSHKLLHKNNNFLIVGSNSQEKVINNSVRLSSSDSDIFDRLYVSDSSEVVSPDADAGAESVFQSSSATSSDGTFVQYMQMSHDSNLTDEDIVLSGVAVPSICRQATSLDYNTAEEALYCPYLTRRSRSLDQEYADDVTFNRSADCDMPNISVTSSNFQDDESNNQEKVFEKYDIAVPIPTCSSSDEDENTRVPEASDDREEHDSEDIDRVISRRSHARHHVRRQHNDLDEEEPIYEDIDDLELLLFEACIDGEPDKRPHPQPLCNSISKLRRKRQHRTAVSDVEKVMLWNEYEAYVVQVKQIGTSACGPTAILNVLKAFDFQVEKDEVTKAITSNLRMEAAPIPYYLFSRYSAGTTAQTLVEGVATATRGAIKGRFFHFYPQRDVELLKWLGYWMKKGAVPVATLNLQKAVKPGWTIPDAWHHQMVYGVSSKGVYLTNPLETVPESVIMEQLSSDSVLLVRRQDVVSRFRDWCPLNEILKQRDPRWCTMNILGQIVHMLREQCMPQEQLTSMKSQLTSHICIPAAYKAGIVLFMRANSDTYEELLKAPELPLKNTPPDTST